MRLRLKSVGFALLLVCPIAIALSAPTLTAHSPVLAQTTQERKAEGDRGLV